MAESSSDFAAHLAPPKKVVLAYSGGLDTSVILRWLIERYGCDVVAFCADLGQGEELAPVREKALRTGASAVHVVDLREDFVRDFIYPMLRAGAIYEGQYAALAPELRVIAPWREWELGSRTALIEFAKRHEIPVPVTAERPYSTDRNLFHVSYEGGILEDPWAEPPPKMFLLTNSPEEAPDVPIRVEVDFEAGDPVAVDGDRLPPVELLTRLNRLGGEHGVGRVDLVENRFVGMKSRGVYETPGGTILHVARRALESLTLDREILHLRDSLVPRYAEMIYYGFWFAPERQALQAFMDECQRDVTGTIRLKLYKGNVTVTGRRSARSLYRTDFATFEADTVYRQRDAEGFINLNALRLRIRALRDRRP